jgi:tetratricopeptide (TPR) repeat protein
MLLQGMDIPKNLRASWGYMELGLFDEAGRELSELSPEESARPETIATWAHLHQSLGQWEPMMVRARELLPHRRESPDVWIMLAYATRRADSIESARAILEEAALLFPGEAVLFFNLACYACQLDRLEEARAQVLKAITLDPGFHSLALTDPDLEPMRGELALLKSKARPRAPTLESQAEGRNEEARQSAFARLVAEGDEKTLTRLLASKSAAAQEAAVEALWTLWMEEQGKLARSTLERGVAAMEAGNLGEAERIFSRLSEIHPDWAEAWNKRATAVFLQKRYDESIQLCRRVVALKPNHFGAWNGLAMCAIQMGDWTSAFEAMRHALSLQPHSVSNQKLMKVIESKL